MMAIDTTEQYEEAADLFRITKRSDSFLCCTDNNVEREGRKARPTPMDLRSIPAEVHAFESHPSHFFVLRLESLH